MAAAVIGGGFFGCSLALALRARGERVTLLEREANLMVRASANNQARVHGGYHYPRSILTGLRSRLNYPRFVAEFGGPSSTDSLVLTNQLLEQERHRVGFAFWIWKENCGGWAMHDGVSCTPGDISPQPSSGCLRAGRERLLARVYPRESADARLSYHYDAGTGAFSLQVHGRAGDPPTVVFIPREVTGEVNASGAVDQLVTTNPDGSRLVTDSPTGGAFSITVTPAPLDVIPCV